MFKHQKAVCFWFTYVWPSADTYAGTCGHAHIRMYMCSEARDQPQVSSTPPKLDMVPVRLVWFAFPALGLHICIMPRLFNVSYWDQTKVPHVCKASILPTKPCSKAGPGFTSAYKSRVGSEVWFVNKSFNTIKSYDFISSHMYIYLCIVRTVLGGQKRASAPWN